MKTFILVEILIDLYVMVSEMAIGMIFGVGNVFSRTTQGFEVKMTIL